MRSGVHLVAGGSGSLPLLLDFEGFDFEANATAEEIFANVRHACSLGLAIIDAATPSGRPVAICGSGPSLAGHLAALDAERRGGAEIWALNGAGEFLSRHGRRPDALVVVGSLPRYAAFLRQDPARRYMLASRCHPDTFAAAPPERTMLFHADVPGIDEHVPPPARFVGSSVSVGITALALAWTAGHRNIRLYGYDSSLREDVLRAPGAGGHDDPICEVVCGAERFVTTPAMAKQAAEFPRWAEEIERGGGRITIHGDGLLPTAWRARADINPTTG